MDIDPKYDDYDFPTQAPDPQPGHPGALTEQHIAQVHQLRLMLEAEGYTERLDTLTLLRFLRARKFDVNASKQMFIDTEKWRKDIDLDTLAANWEYPEKKDLAQYYKQFYHKTDKDGRPIYIETLGGIDLTAMYKITSSERMLNNLAVEYERVADPRLPACSRKAGHLLETCCSIIDLKGVAITRVPQVYSYVRQASVISQNYYPERLGKMYLINAPWGFSTVWSVVKGWLDPVVAGKVHFAKTIDELSNYVPRSQIPTELGGDEKWEYKYPEPVPGENDKMADEKPKQELQSERQQIVDKYETTVLEWVHAGDSVPAEEKRKERDAVAEQLRQNYWKLDPYVRARSLYDRAGVLLDGGKLEFYGKAPEPAVAPAKATETSADDLD